MKVLGIVILIIVVAALAAGGGYWFARHHESEASRTTEPGGDSGDDKGGDAKEDAVVDVTVAPIVKRTIEQKTQLYGSIVAEPSDLHIQSVPFESRIVRVLVTAGQDIAPDTVTVQLEASPDALLSLEEASKQLEFAQKDFDQVQQRVKDRLATNQELSQAQQTLDAAKLKHKSLIDRGVGKPHELKAAIKGNVSKIDVQEGQIVPAGGALVELAASRRVEAKLGASLDLAAKLKPGQAIALRAVDQSDGEAVQGKVRVIAGRVDPATRLAEVRVTLPADSKLLIDSFVTGAATLAAADGLVVPRSAATVDESDEYAVFTVRDGKASKHAVKLGLQSGDDVQVVGEGLNAGDPVVVSGNSLLDDGMKVKVSEAPATAPTSEPTGEASKEDRS